MKGKHISKGSISPIHFHSIWYKKRSQSVSSKKLCQTLFVHTTERVTFNFYDLHSLQYAKISIDTKTDSRNFVEIDPRYSQD